MNVQVRNSRTFIKSPSQGRMKILRTKNDGMIRLDDSCQPTRLLPDDNYVCVNVRFVFATRFPGGYVYRVRSSSCRRRVVSSSCRVVSCRVVSSSSKIAVRSTILREQLRQRIFRICISIFYFI